MLIYLKGIYTLISLNPLSNYELSMELSYPNSFDVYWAKKTGRTNLGDDIFIHGGDRSIGCVAIGDDAIQKLYPLVAKVGIHNVTVIIAPNDLRRQPAIIDRHAPSWLPELYAELSSALKAFPLSVA